MPNVQRQDGWLTDGWTGGPRLQGGWPTSSDVGNTMIPAQVQHGDGWPTSSDVGNTMIPSQVQHVAGGSRLKIGCAKTVRGEAARRLAGRIVGPTIASRFAVLALTVLLMARVASAAEQTLEQRVETLNQALRAFDQGAELRRTQPAEATRRFVEAAEKFQSLVDSGLRNGKLYYNLGNAWLQSGQIGRAILNYRRAENLIPGDGQLEANLRFARTLRKSQIAMSGEQAFFRTFFVWHYRLPLRTRYALAIAAYIAFWMLLLARVLKPGLRWGFAIAPVLLVWLALGASVGYQQVVQSRNNEGVILTDDVIVRKGNGEGYEPMFEQPLHEGVEFSVLEQRRDWLRITLPDGQSGWIRATQAEII